MPRLIYILRRLLPVALLATIVAAPFAIPVPWVALMQWVTGTRQANSNFLPSPVDNQAWFIIWGSVTLAFIAIVTPPPPAINAFRRNPIALIALSWFAITLVRGLLHPNFGPAWGELFLQGSFLLLFGTALQVSHPHQVLLKLQQLLVLAALPVSGIALLQNAGYDPLPYSQTLPGTTEEITGKHLIASTFGHPNYMGSFLAPVIALAAGLAINAINLSWRLAAAVSAIAATAALIAGGTRGPILATVAGAGVVIIWHLRHIPGRQRTRLLTIAGGTVVILIAALLLIPALRPLYDITGRIAASKEIASRSFYWLTGLHMFRNAPIFGIGPGQFDLQFWKTIAEFPATAPGREWHFILESVIRGVRPGQMHNDHLQVLVETGLVGAAVWAALWTAILYRTMQTDQPSALNSATTGALVAVGIDAMFGFPLHLPCSGALFWVLLALWSQMKSTSPQTLLK